MSRESQTPNTSDVGAIFASGLASPFSSDRNASRSDAIDLEVPQLVVVDGEGNEVQRVAVQDEAVGVDLVLDRLGGPLRLVADQRDAAVLDPCAERLDDVRPGRVVPLAERRAVDPFGEFREVVECRFRQPGPNLGERRPQRLPEQGAIERRQMCPRKMQRGEFVPAERQRRTGLGRQRPVLAAVLVLLVPEGEADGTQVVEVATDRLDRGSRLVDEIPDGRPVPTRRENPQDGPLPDELPSVRHRGGP